MENPDTFYDGSKRIKSEIKKENQRLFMRRLLANKSLLIGGIILIIIGLIAILGPSFLSNTPYQIFAEERLSAPSREFIFGTDNMGRDLLSRVIFGARVSLFVGLMASGVTALVGLMVGLYASYYRFLDHILMRICDGLMAFPAILLALAIMAALGANALNVIVALSIVMIPTVARVIRSAALVVQEQTFIEAIKAQGAGSFRVIWVHIAPNVLSHLIIQATYVFAISIIIEASLSFMGVGIPAPDPSWGNIIYEGKIHITRAWWMTLFPGAFILSTVIALNLFGDGLRDFLDPYTIN
mgnify:CR=1 FL=1